MRRYQALAALADAVVVEGAGGFHVPLNDTQTGADLAQALALPVVLVVGLRLGCLNHALLTAEAIRARGLTLAGWVANRVDPDMAGRRRQHRLPARPPGRAAAGRRAAQAPPDARSRCSNCPGAWLMTEPASATSWLDEIPDAASPTSSKPTCCAAARSCSPATARA